MVKCINRSKAVQKAYTVMQRKIQGWQKHHPKETKKGPRQLLSRPRAQKKSRKSLGRTTTLPLNRMASIGTPQCSGKIEIHEAATNRALAATTKGGDEQPSKHPTKWLMKILDGLELKSPNLCL